MLDWSYKSQNRVIALHHCESYPLKMYVVEYRHACPRSPWEILYSALDTRLRAMHLGGTLGIQFSRCEPSHPCQSNYTLVTQRILYRSNLRNQNNGDWLYRPMDGARMPIIRHLNLETDYFSQVSRLCQRIRYECRMGYGIRER